MIHCAVARQHPHDFQGPFIRTPSTRPAPSVTAGVWFGLCAVTIWAGYQAYARAGVNGGLTAADFIFLRFATAGVLTLPFLLRAGVRDLGGVGWGRGVALSLVAGPLFIGFGVGGYNFAPLAVGAVVIPATITLVSVLAAWWLLRSTPQRAQYAGIAVVLVGLGVILIASPRGGGEQPLLGAAMFTIAGALWAVFTVLLKKWAVGPMAATAAVSVLSAVVTVPVYLWLYGVSHFVSLSPQFLLLQVLIQGVLSGVLAIVAFTKAVAALGAQNAALLTALVPGIALVIGVPVTGELPNGGQLAGAITVMLGLTASVLLPRLAAARR